jgi:hypothetical protein
MIIGPVICQLGYRKGYRITSLNKCFDGVLDQVKYIHMLIKYVDNEHMLESSREQVNVHIEPYVVTTVSVTQCSAF